MLNLKSKAIALSVMVSVLGTFNLALAKVSMLDFKNTKQHYSIKYPSNWKKTPDKESVMFQSPPQSAQYAFVENTIVVREKVPGYNVETYYQGNLKDLKKTTKKFKLIKSATITVNGIDSRYIVYTHVDNNITYKIKIYFFYVDGFGYIVLSTAKDSTFAKYEKQFDQISTSFKVTK